MRFSRERKLPPQIFLSRYHLPRVALNLPYNAFWLGTLKNFQNFSFQLFLKILKNSPKKKRFSAPNLLSLNAGCLIDSASDWDYSAGFRKYKMILVTYHILEKIKPKVPKNPIFLLEFFGTLT
jgi:hypothetical protein